MGDAGTSVLADVPARSTGLPQGDADEDATNGSRPGPVMTISRGGDDGSGALGDSGPGRVDQRRPSRGEVHGLLQNNFRLYRKGGNDLMGTCGGSGFGGSISAKGLLDIFEATDVYGRSIIDLGGGNGIVAVSAGLYGASNALALELSANTGYFHIFKSVISIMNKNPFWQVCMEACSFDLTKALKPGDIDEVAHVRVVLFHC